MRLRTVLFVPGDRPDRVDKAYSSGADGVVVDLEDAVAATAKAQARDLAAAAIRDRRDRGCLVAVRVNAADTGLQDADLDALAAALPALDAVVVPKAASPTDVIRVAHRLAQLERAAGIACGRVALLPVIESAAGVLAAESVAAAHDRVRTLVFGPADLSLQLGVTPTADGIELLHARSRLVLAAAATGRAAPLDGPYFALDDTEGLARSAALARRLGFGGKVVIHPRQIDVTRAAFEPTAAELAWARDVDEAFTLAERRGVSSIRLADGTFVDYPVAHRARELLAGGTGGR